MRNSRNSKDTVQREYSKVLKKEASFLKNNMEKATSKLDDFLEDKVPDKLHHTLDMAFAKSFALIFDKGTVIIEKSYNKENIKNQYEINNFALNLKKDRKSLKTFSKQASSSSSKNVLISGVKGVGLGALGIGLPDIPVFIGMVLKGIYEIALQYGYEYDTYEERYYILNLIKTAFSHGNQLIESNKLLNEFSPYLAIPYEYTQDIKIKEVSSLLSTELLCMKFLQGVPIVGVVGGITDAMFTNKVLSFAKIKYHQRFLTDVMKRDGMFY